MSIVYKGKDKTMSSINLTTVGLPAAQQQQTRRYDVEHDYHVSAEISDSIVEQLKLEGHVPEIHSSADNSFFVDRSVFRQYVIEHQLYVRSIFTSTHLNNLCLGWAAVPKNLRLKN